jgi:hypothetical protein
MQAWSIPREIPVVASVMIFADLHDMYLSWNFVYWLNGKGGW